MGDIVGGVRCSSSLAEDGGEDDCKKAGALSPHGMLTARAKERCGGSGEEGGLYPLGSPQPHAAVGKF